MKIVVEERDMYRTSIYINHSTTKHVILFLLQRIGQRCQSYPYTCIEAKKTENKPLNRYRDVNPYDHSRIIIRKEGFVTDYINANLVKVSESSI